MRGRMPTIPILPHQEWDADADRLELWGMAEHAVQISTALGSCQTPRTAKVCAANEERLFTCEAFEGLVGFPK